MRGEAVGGENSLLPPCEECAKFGPVTRDASLEKLILYRSQLRLSIGRTQPVPARPPHLPRCLDPSTEYRNINTYRMFADAWSSGPELPPYGAQQSVRHHLYSNTPEAARN